MRGKRAKQIRHAVLNMTVGWGKAETKREIKRFKRKYYQARHPSCQSKPVTSGYFCARLHSRGKHPKSGRPLDLHPTT